jgi:DNA-binding IclR family transcriptional regulator
MFDLADVSAFARIAELGSVSGAARSLRMPKSSVSRSLMRLEEALGAVLVERSTRHLRLTDAGLLAVLPELLAIGFRGVLSFWTAGEIPDHLLSEHARATAAVALLGFVGPEDRAKLLEASALMSVRDQKPSR